MKRKAESAAESAPTSADDDQREQRVADRYAAKLPHKGEKHDEYQKGAFKDIVNGHSVFLTGAGGCGKTFLLRDVHFHFAQHKYRTAAFTSMTGVTAIMISGKTFASFFGFGIEEGDKTKMWELVRKKAYLAKRFRSLSALVIDEVSMLSAEQLEAASYVAGMFRKSPHVPFGGLQVILCGDFSQLPPIGGAYAFLSPLWDQLNLRYHELKGNHRQSSDIGFYMMLNSVRVGNVDTYVRNTLKERVDAVLDLPEGVETAELTSRRDDAQKINEDRLMALDASTEQCYFARFTWLDRGTLTEAAASTVEKQIRKNMVTPPQLRLRQGALVMLTCNLDLANELGNGSMGVVKEFREAGSRDGAKIVIAPPEANATSGSTKYPVVEFSGGRQVHILPHTWTKTELTDGSTSSYAQVPLILAYAITVHRSQGSTVEWVSMKLDRSCFADGMAYVALSRARSLKGIQIKAFHPESIQTSPHVLEFYRKHRLAGLGEADGLAVK